MQVSLKKSHTYTHTHMHAPDAVHDICTHCVIMISHDHDHMHPWRRRRPYLYIYIYMASASASAHVPTSHMTMATETGYWSFILAWYHPCLIRAEKYSCVLTRQLVPLACQFFLHATPRNSFSLTRSRESAVQAV